MPPIQPFDTPLAPDIPVLDDVVTPGDGNPLSPKVAAAAPAPRKPAAVVIPKEILSEMLTERIAALTDRLLRDASAEVQGLLMEKVWEKLRREIPAIVTAALKENGHDG
ncbi:MAG: hypothetical protein KGJ08_02500 [Gammaproteobacteria bacterium]|nr:hypothetical protein [Gammaproteobacteria bacterium]